MTSLVFCWVKTHQTKVFLQSKQGSNRQLGMISDIQVLGNCFLFCKRTTSQNHLKCLGAVCLAVCHLTCQNKAMCIWEELSRGADSQGGLIAVKKKGCFALLFG